VNGGCVYLYRAVDEKGHTVASHLSRTGDQTAARIFSGTGAERHGPAALRSTASAKPYGTAQNGQRNDFNYRWRTPVISAAASTRLQAREVPRCRNAGLELFRECPYRAPRHRTHPEAEERLLWRSVQLRHRFSRDLVPRPCRLNERRWQPHSGSKRHQAGLTITGRRHC
jgi:hypothetical protein